MEMKVGQFYKNILGDVHQLTHISKTALKVKAKNIKTGEVSGFRYFEASGHYIKDKTHSTTLGNISTETHFV